jgi:hypothetical protein
MSDAESAVPGDGKRRDGRRKASRVLSFAAAGVLIVGVAGFGYAYERLNSNIRTA